MKNERGLTMKRFLCALLILCFVPICAFALDLSEFNIYASVLGSPEINEDELKSSGKYKGITQGDSNIYFEEDENELNSIFVDGNGEDFLAYCCAAIHVFDPNGDTTRNHGQLLTMYFLARTKTEHQTGETSNGLYFFIEPSEKGFLFMIGK